MIGLNAIKDSLMGYPVRLKLNSEQQLAFRDWRHRLKSEPTLGLGITSDRSIAVYHERNAKPDLPSSLMIPNWGCIPLKLIEVSQPVAQSFQGLERPVRPGSSISHIRHDAGTASLYVQRKIGPQAGDRLLLSCEHVLYSGFNGDSSRVIMQPAVEDSIDELEDERIAVRVDRGGLSFTGVNTIDAAVARVRADVEITNQPLGASFTIREASSLISTNDELIVFGRSSSEVRGQVQDTDVNMRIGYEISPGNRRVANFRNIVRAQYPNAPGDSGAPVVNARTQKIIGIHIAGDTEQGVGYFCRINKVFATLQVGLP